MTHPSLTPRQRLFTDEFKVGDSVAIIRYEHGWFDGSVTGVITTLDTHSCVVKCLDGEWKSYTFNIEHPRDIRRVKRRR